jgi:hypothetical protein
MTRLAIVDGASAYEIDATISLEARGTPIRGAFVVIDSGNDRILGRITEITMSNPIHQDTAFAPTIMKQGSIPFWSADVDIEKAKVEIIAVLDTATMERVPLRRNASSGTPIQSADQTAMNQFALEKQHFVVLGHVPNSGLLASVVNRHNGPASNDDGDLGGYGEARHTAIFGQSGSAKTVLLTTLLAGRLAAHPQLGLLMPDTSGDLADPTRHSRGDFQWNYAEVLKTAGVKIERIKIADIRLTSTATLIKKLAPVFRNRINMAAENAQRLADYVVNDLFGESDVDVARLTTEAILTLAEQHIAKCYSAAAQKKEKPQEVNEILQTPNRRAVFDSDFRRVRELFDGRFPVRDLVRDVLQNSRKIIIEMTGISQADHQFVMREIMMRMIGVANKIFHSGEMANALVVLDEGQRWVPEGTDDEEGLSEMIKDGFRTTRKLGVGWFVVAQSPAGLSKKVIRDCHTWWFGRNLGIGADRSHIEDILSKEGAEAYRLLAIQGGYFWIGAGLDNNIGTGTSYFTLHPFGGDATAAFIEANSHIFRGQHAATTVTDTATASTAAA